MQDGGKRYVIQRLRKGVRFHNGKEMGAADVVASLRRWGAVSSTGKTIFKTVEAVEAPGVPPPWRSACGSRRSSFRRLSAR